MELLSRAVSSVGRASRLHREGHRFVSLDKPYLIYIQPLFVTLTSHLVTKTKGERHEHNKENVETSGKA